MDRNLRRKRNYQKLRKAGFTNKLATKLKDYREDKILELCDIVINEEPIIKEQFIKVLGKSLGIKVIIDSDGNIYD
jgi:hypothetical protein